MLFIIIKCTSQQLFFWKVLAYALECPIAPAPITSWWKMISYKYNRGRCCVLRDKVLVQINLVNFFILFPALQWIRTNECEKPCRKQPFKWAALRWAIKTPRSVTIVFMLPETGKHEGFLSDRQTATDDANFDSVYFPFSHPSTST